MELKSEFEVNVPVERAWAVLTDIERIAPCMPGAELREVEGDEYRGAVKVKVGPITAEYRGKVTFLERDEASHRAVLRAQGREVRGQGHASATISATLEPSQASTRVSVVTELTITGRVAQLGRGVLADVSNNLMSVFVECLELDLLASSTGPGPGAEEEPVAAVPLGDEAVPVAEPVPPSEPHAESPAANEAAEAENTALGVPVEAKEPKPAQPHRAREAAAGAPREPASRHQGARTTRSHRAHEAGAGEAGREPGAAPEGATAPTEPPAVHAGGRQTVRTASPPPAPGGPGEDVPVAELVAEPGAEVPSGAGGSGETAPAETSLLREVAGPSSAPVDLIRVAGPSLLKRALPALVLLAALVTWVLVRRRLRRGR